MMNFKKRKIEKMSGIPNSNETKNKIPKTVCAEENRFGKISSKSTDGNSNNNSNNNNNNNKVLWTMPAMKNMGWARVLAFEFKKPYFAKLRTDVLDRAATKTVYPPGEKLWAAFDQCPYDKVRVVILGQDPYINPGQAEGMSFSVPLGVPLPPSLENILKEITSDDEAVNSYCGTANSSTEIDNKLNTDCSKDVDMSDVLAQCLPVFKTKEYTSSEKSGHLGGWAQQGVFLLNSILTVDRGQSGSHEKLGWEIFTDCVINTLAKKKHKLVFLLWGGFAKKKSELISEFVKSNGHLVLSSVHPSPRSAHMGFFGCKHFSQTNKFLLDNGFAPIKWL